jgi:hypothetical protein
MRLTTRILALAIALGAFTMPLSANAGHNNNQMQQMLMLNSVNAQEQTVSNQINAYVASGQLTPQQGAAFSSELSQLSSQAMMGGANSMTALSEINSLSAQITASLNNPNPYVYGAATAAYGANTNPYVYGAATRAYAAPGTAGFYNNWRSGLSGLSTEQNYIRDKELQAQRNAVAEQNLLNKTKANDALHHEHWDQAHAADAERHYNDELKNLHSEAERETYKRTHPAPWGH